MEHLEDQDVIRLKELLRRTGEFITYFELAETKMMEWRQDLEHQATLQEQQFHQQLNTLRTELGTLEEIFTQAGLARFRLAADNNLNQGKEILLSMQRIEQQMLKFSANHQRDIAKLSENILANISQHASDAITRIDAQLAQYDVHHFHRIASESCEHVEKAAQNAIVKSSKILKLFQWRSVALVFFATLCSAFAIGLYMNDEYPWEIHQHAINERDAGKMLMNAWSKLSYQEKIKILGERSTG